MYNLQTPYEQPGVKHVVCVCSGSEDFCGYGVRTFRIYACSNLTFAVQYLSRCSTHAYYSMLCSVSLTYAFAMSPDIYEPERATNKAENRASQTAKQVCTSRQQMSWLERGQK